MCKIQSFNVQNTQLKLHLARLSSPVVVFWIALSFRVWNSYLTICHWLGGYDYPLTSLTSIPNHKCWYYQSITQNKLGNNSTLKFRFFFFTESHYAWKEDIVKTVLIFLNQKSKCKVKHTKNNINLKFIYIYNR